MNLSINKLTKISIIILLSSIFLSLIGFNSIFSTEATSVAPFSIILSQTIWNAVKVFFYGLLVLKLIIDRSRLVKILFLITILLLPFSQYLLSPGGLLLSILMFTLFLIELQNESQIINIDIQEGKKEKHFSFQKFEILGFLCCFLCSLYNAKASEFCFPFWSDWFSLLNNILHLSKDASTFMTNLYSMGLDIPIPLSLPHANDNVVGLLIFSLIWSILPFLYVVYFVALYIESKKSHYEKVQKILCLFCIFHFLFITNLVGYRFSRGWDNSYAEWFHWSERVAWLIAILLPIYQNLSSGFWKKNSKLTPLHLFMLICTIFYLIYEVFIYHILDFISFIKGEDVLFFETFRQYGLYHGALVFMSLYYLFRIILNSKSHLWIITRNSNLDNLD